jgi:hypothetical protein
VEGPKLPVAFVALIDTNWSRCHFVLHSGCLFHFLHKCTAVADQTEETTGCVEPQYSQPLNSIGRCKIRRRLVPLASSLMDVYVNIYDRSEIATSFESRNTTSRTVKSSYNFSASTGTLLEGSAVSQPTAEKVEERSHDAVPLALSDFNLEKTWECRSNLQLEDAARQSALLFFRSMRRFGRSSQVGRKFWEREIPNFCM